MGKHTPVKERQYRPAKPDYTKWTFHGIGTLYGTPTTWVAACQDGEDVILKEVPSGESVYYPTAPWYKRLPLWMFYDLPFHKTFDKSLTKPEIELALLGQFYNKSQWEWPNTFDTKYLVDHTNDPSFTNGRLVVNLNDPHHVSNYWGIGHHIII